MLSVKRGTAVVSLQNSARIFGNSSAAAYVSEIFDRQLKVAHRERAALLVRGAKEDPLLAEMAERTLDRLEDCNRTFARIAVIGGAGESIIRRLTDGRAGIKQVFHCEASEAMLRRVQDLQQEKFSGERHLPEVLPLLADEEFLPLGAASLDAVISCLGLHWVNDIPGAMTQCRMALKPDGLFLGSMWGGNTLQELRIACTMAEEATDGGVSQRVSPLVQVRDAGNLLTRAGFSIPSVDVDEITAHYHSLDELRDHLRRMGESNAVRVRQPTFHKKAWAAAKKAYANVLTEEERQSGSIPATFQAIYMTGWAPHERQQSAARRGSATVSLQDLAALRAKL